MRRGWVLLFPLFLTLAVVARASESKPACGTVDNPCLDNSESPAPPVADQSALAPIPMPMGGPPLKNTGDGHQALSNGHDSELFFAPDKTSAHVDPYSPEAVAHIRLVPEPH